LRDSPARTRIILGDGRLSLARAPDKHYGLIILDAFSSDAIPVHLLTREAVRNVYLHKLADHGLLLFHISNRYLDLQSVLADVARDAGLVCRVSTDLGNWEIGKAPSIWVVMALSPRDLASLDERWRDLEGSPGRPVWTDDFSNVVRIVRWN
jgi:spermidine synthase